MYSVHLHFLSMIHDAISDEKQKAVWSVVIEIKARNKNREPTVSG